MAAKRPCSFTRQSKKSLDISRKSVILVDIGGGSVEIAHSNNGDFQKIISLPLGTLRSLAQLGTDQYEGFQKFVDKFRPDVQKFFKEIKTSPSIAVGAGGCLDCLINLKKKMISSKAFDCITHKEIAHDHQKTGFDGICKKNKISGPFILIVPM